MTKYNKGLKGSIYVDYNKKLKCVFGILNIMFI